MLVLVLVLVLVVLILLLILVVVIDEIARRRWRGTVRVGSRWRCSRNNVSRFWIVSCMVWITVTGPSVATDSRSLRRRILIDPAATVV